MDSINKELRHLLYMLDIRPKTEIHKTFIDDSGNVRYMLSNRQALIDMYKSGDNLNYKLYFDLNSNMILVNHLLNNDQIKSIPFLHVP